MTREQFTYLVMKIIFSKEFYKGMPLFESHDLDDYRISESDGYNDSVASMPIDEFLDDIYDAIWGEVDE